MSNANEHTEWAASAGPGEAKLDLKEPIAEHDPNVGTQWAPPVDRSKPRPRVPRDIDKYLDQPTWTCPDCGLQTMTETGKAAHLRAGQDGMTLCQRDKARFRPVKNCSKCGGTGRGAGQCPSCKGSGDGEFTAKCRGCNGKGVLRDGSSEPCTVCDGSGTRTYCADCSGSGEISHCSACRGSGKVQADEAQEASQAMDSDALAKKIAEPIIASMKEGFLMLADVLNGNAGAAKPSKSAKVEKVRKKKARGSRGTSEGIPGGAPAGGSEPVPGLERSDESVGDSPSQPEEA